MDRNNETWLAHLRSDGSEHQLALSDLRGLLLRGLRGVFWKQKMVDDTFLEDIVQDSIIRILDRIQQFEGRSKFMTWAISIAIRVGMSELRHRRWKDVSLEEVIGDAVFITERFADATPEPDLQREKNAIIEKLYDVIQNALTEKQRIALLAELREIPQDEIARRIGSSRNAVYKLTHDARKRLKQELEAAGYGTNDIQTIFAG